MRPWHAILALGVALSLTGFASAAPTKVKKTHHHHHHVVTGVVVEVHHEKGEKGEGSFEIRVHHHAKKGKTAKTAATAAKAAAKSAVEKIEVTAATKFEKADEKAGTFGELHKGERVTVHLGAKGHVATEVEILSGEHHHKKGTGKTALAKKRTGKKTKTT
jgi:hypothetical protein